MAQQEDRYPVQLEVDYPDGPLNRLSSFFRVIFIIPIIAIIALLGGGRGVGPNEAAIGVGGTHAIDM